MHGTWLNRRLFRWPFTLSRSFRPDRVVAVSRPATWVAALCADADARLAQLAGLYTAASALPNGAGAAVRVAAIDRPQRGGLVGLTP
jgi:hypothetical protein